MMRGEKSIIMHQNHSEEEDEETISLCDLPMYDESPQSKNDNRGLLSCNYSEGDHHTSSSLDGQSDNFEFFSDEWSSPMPFSAENILFCGKLIVNKGYKQSDVSENPQKLMETSKKRTEENHSVLQWNFNSRTSKPHDKKGKCMNNTHRNDILANRITILKSSRWFVFLFKSNRIPIDMEIKETRQRQKKTIVSQKSQVATGKITSSKSRGLRWWKLIRLLGCDNLHRADAVIKSSYNCAPLIRE